jgi:hypothetical protein
MTDRPLGSPKPEWAAFLATHWANKKHAWSSYVADVSKREHEEITHSPEDIHVWVSQLKRVSQTWRLWSAWNSPGGTLLFALANTATLFFIRSQNGPMSGIELAD